MSVAKVISVLNWKGGVGKTTLAHHLGTGLQELSLSDIKEYLHRSHHPRVLLIDLDAQCNLSISCLRDDKFENLVSKAQNHGQSQSQPVIHGDKSTSAIEEVLERLKEMDRDETKVYLNTFTKNQLLEICSRIDIKPRSKDTKSNIITIIAEHFGFIKLNQQIASRRSNMSGEIWSS